MAIINVITYVVVLIMPMHSVWSLQVSTRKKWQLSAMFSLGEFVCEVSLVRVFYNLKFYCADPTYSGDGVEGAELTLLECCSEIKYCCLSTSMQASSPPKRKRDTVHTRWIPCLRRLNQTESSYSTLAGSSSTVRKPRVDGENRLYIPLT